MNTKSHRIITIIIILKSAEEIKFLEGKWKKKFLKCRLFQYMIYYE